MKNQELTIELPSGLMSLKINETDIPAKDLFGFACRQNPKRGFLFVSKVLGKHYPAKPVDIFNTYNLLSEKLNNLLAETDSPLFIGFAETATGLGAGIYDSWKTKRPNVNSLFIHTTRYNFNKNVLINFQEEHSHSTGHIVFEPEEHIDTFNNTNTLILIDDEITTGNTLKNFITAFVEKYSNIKKVIILSLKNWMHAEAIKTFKEDFYKLDICFSSILTGEYKFSANPNYVCEKMPNVDSGSDFKDEYIPNNFGRFGIDKFPDYDLKSKIEGLDFSKKTLVIGTGEFHYQPLLLAKYLESLGVEVYYQSTTRSPISLGNDIENKLSFIDNYRDNIPNFIYNVQLDQYEQVLICYETSTKNNLDLDIQLNAHNIFFN